MLLTIVSDNHWNIVGNPSTQHQHRFLCYRCQCSRWSHCWTDIFAIVGVAWASSWTILLNLNFDVKLINKQFKECQTVSYSLYKLWLYQPRRGNLPCGLWTERHIHFRNHHYLHNCKCISPKTFHWHRGICSSWHFGWHPGRKIWSDWTWIFNWKTGMNLPSIRISNFHSHHNH